MNDGIGRIFKRLDGKYLIYLPVAECEDTMFPFRDFKPTKRGALAIFVRVHFDSEAKTLVISKKEDKEDS